MNRALPTFFATLGIMLINTAASRANPFWIPAPGDPMAISHNAPATVKKTTGFGYTVTVTDKDKADQGDPTSTLPDNSLDCGGAILSMEGNFSIQSQGPGQLGVRKWNAAGTSKTTVATYIDSWSAVNNIADTRRKDAQVFTLANILVTN